MKTLLLIPALALLACGAALSQAPAPLTPPGVLGRAKTIQFTATLSVKGKKEEVSVAYLAQPNRAFVQDVDAKTKAIDTVYASDGVTQIEYRKSRSHYTKTAAPGRIADMDSRTVALSTLTDFLDPKAFAKFERLGSDRAGFLYALALGDEDGYKTSEVLTLDGKLGLPKTISITRSQSKGFAPDYVGVEVERIDFSGWKLDAPIDDGRFAYVPPADARLYVVPKLLANGTDAPDFTAQDKDGKAVHLSDYKDKVVVLDFWATWCGPCQVSLPHTTEIAKQDAGKGVVVLAVNVWDTPKAFQAWIPKHPQYNALHFAIDPSGDRDKGIASGQYGVSGIPTQYVIGRDGRIVKSIVGYEAGSTGLEDGLKAAGVSEAAHH